MDSQALPSFKLVAAAAAFAIGAVAAALRQSHQFLWVGRKARAVMHDKRSENVFISDSL